jgi:hypothetical protein
VLKLSRQKWRFQTISLLAWCERDRPDAIWQRDANFQFSMTFNFNIFQCFSNIRNHLSNFSYLVCISCKIFIHWRFYLFLKTENSRRVAESRPVCMDLKGPFTRAILLRFQLRFSPFGGCEGADQL